MTADSIHLVPLTPAELPRFREFLGRDDFGGCFCAVWTGFGKAWGAQCGDPSQPNFTRTEREVKEGRQAGFFIIEGETLVGWTGCGPKPEFPILAEWPGSRLSPSSPETWSIGCLALRAESRSHGYPDRVLPRIVEEATRQGAQVIEAYPSRPWTEPRAYRGSLSLYERHGFREAGAEAAGDSEIVLVERRIGS